MSKWTFRIRKSKDVPPITPEEAGGMDLSNPDAPLDAPPVPDMQQPHQEGLGKVDKALLALSIIVLLVSVALLFNDNMFSDVDLNHLTVVGEVKNSAKDVRRKVNNGFAWDNVSTRDTVFEGDSIFTGVGSSTEITLNNGSTLKVDEKSLVVVRTNNGVIELDLQYGTVVGSNIKNDSSVVIYNNGERTALVPSTEPIRIKKEQSGLKQKVEVTSGEKNVKEEGPSYSVVLDSPKADARIWKKDNAKIPFSWKEKKPLEDPVIEFAGDSAFNTVLGGYSAGTSGQTQLAKLPEHDGSLYWRIRDDKTKQLSQPRKLFVYPDHAAVLLSPDNSRELILDDKEDKMTVAFSWDDDAGSKDWKLQISKTQNFVDLVEEISATRRRVESKPMPPGKYFWRVAGEHPQRPEAPWSETWSFTINSFGKLVPPQLENPQVQYEIPQSVLQKATTTKNLGPMPVHESEAPAMKWKSVPNVKAYVIEVSSDNEFKKKTEVRVKDKTAFALDKVAPRTVYWRVRSVDGNGMKSEASQVGEMKIGLPAPRLQPMKSVTQKFKNQKEADEAKTAAELKWNPVPFAAGYEVDASKDPMFKTSKTMKEKATSKKLTLTSPGDFFFRVRAVDNKGRPVSAYSPVAPFTYSKEVPVIVPPPRDVAAIPPTPQVQPELGVNPKLPVPQLRDPNNKTSVVTFGKSPVFLNFRWRPVQGAKNYKIEISDTPEFTQVLSEYKTGETNFFFEKSLPAGTLYWRVRGEFPTEATRWSNPNTFTVQYK